MNKRIILLVSFIAFFIILMIPVKPAIEHQNKQIILNPVKKSIDYTSFKKMISQIHTEEILKKLKEKNYNLVFIKDISLSRKNLTLITQSDNCVSDFFRCENLKKTCWRTYICMFIFSITPLVIFFSIELQILLNTAILYSCNFINEYPWYMFI